MATKLDFQQIERNGGAIQFNEWASAPRAEIVNRACDQFLASACFSLDKNGGIRRGDALDLFEYRFQSRTATYDLLESARISILVGGSESCNSCHERPPYESGNVSRRACNIHASSRSTTRSYCLRDLDVAGS